MEPGFLGFVDLEDTLISSLLVTNTSGTPIDADAAPTFRVYGPNGFIESGTTTQRNSGTITAATNASPIVITSADHGLTTGSYITVSGVGGNTAANGTFLITRVDANNFSLDGSTGNNTYTSGGEWHAAGLYKVTIPALGVSGYEKSEAYQVAFNYEISSTSYGQLHAFQVS